MERDHGARRCATCRTFEAMTRRMRATPDFEMTALRSHCTLKSLQCEIPAMENPFTGNSLHWKVPALENPRTGNSLNFWANDAWHQDRGHEAIRRSNAGFCHFMSNRIVRHRIRQLFVHDVWRIDGAVKE